VFPVGVARALASNPRVILMDEPFGSLDAITRNDLQQEILRLKKQLNKTIVFVTHDVFEALRLGDRLAVMHQGKLEQIGCKEELIHSSATAFVQELLQKTSQQIQTYAGHFA
jgi:osmoprotectant transport system ATP-binding protein